MSDLSPEEKKSLIIKIVVSLILLLVVFIWGIVL